MNWKSNVYSILLMVLFFFCLLPVGSQAALVAHWTFDEGSGTQVVDTVGGLIGTLSATGATLVTGGKAGGALSLNKADTGYVTMGDVLRLGTGPYSFVVWVKTSTTDPTTAVLAKHWSGSPSSYFIGINHNDAYGADNKAWFYNLSPEKTPFSDTSVNDDQWHQIIGVRGNGEVKIYVDGLPVESSQLDQGLDNPPLGTPFLVGGYSVGGNPVSTYTGLIDDIQVYSHMLTDVEVQWLYDHPGQALPCTPAPSGLVSWWGGDNNALDMVGGYNGTLHGDTTYAAGKVGQSFSFDGNGDYVSIPQSANLPVRGTNSFTIDAWVKNSDGSMFNVFAFRPNENTNVQFFIDGTTTSIWVPEHWLAQINHNVDPTEWNHFAYVRNGNTWRLYVNGVQVGSDIIDAIDLGNPITTQNIGAPGCVCGQWAKGQIDEVEIFNRALSAEEIAAIYNSGSAGKCRSCTPPPSGMVSWWRGENNANDSIGGNNGTLIGDTAFATGRVGQAFSFDGGGNYVEVVTNKALNAPIQALTNTVLGDPANAVDGNMGTIWYSYQGVPSNIQFIVDLGTEIQIEKIIFQAAQTESYIIETSSDGVIWTPRHNGVFNYFINPPTTINVQGAYTARYIRYYGDNAQNGYVGIAEIEIYVVNGLDNLGNNPFTVDFWMFANNAGSGTYIMGKSDPDGGQGWDIRLDNSRIRLEGINGWDPNYNWESDASATPNTWHHIAVSATDSSLSVYIDGVLKGTTSRSTISTATNPFRIGYTTQFGGSAYNGIIDEVAFFNRALGADEIAAIYNAGSAGICAVKTIFLPLILKN